MANEGSAGYRSQTRDHRVEFPGYRVTRNLGVVRASCALTQYRRHNGAGLQTLFGGNITSTRVCEQAREDAHRLWSNTPPNSAPTHHRRGYDATELTGGVTEVLA